MKWKKFKKERISLNYTIMLLPHSQKKPIHFKTPVWTFGLFFLALLVLTGTCLFFAGSRVQLKQVQAEKNHLEKEWEKLAAQKEKADKENEQLKQARETQEQELKELEQKTRNTIKELEDLVERENQIREELGLQQVAESGETENQSPEERTETANNQLPEDRTGGTENQNPEGIAEGTESQNPEGMAGGTESQNPEDMAKGTESQNPEGMAEGTESQPQEGTIDIQAENGVPLAGGEILHALSAEYSRLFAENTADFQGIQAELAFLQTSLTEKTSQYDHYLNTIEARREAEAAEIARKEALRLSIVRNALQYVGNPYVYGGNNPNTGVDCSGFTKYILANTAGVSLNRTAASQSTQGQAISAEEARPGDLVFYSNGASVNHVAIYIGEGRVVHASNERVGITTSNMYYRTPVKIVNVLGD